MKETKIVLVKHEQRLKSLEKDLSALMAVQTEIHAMNESLVTLATEIKHTNEHLSRHEQKIAELDSKPKMRMDQLVTAIIAALAGGIISVILGLIFK